MQNVFFLYFWVQLLFMLEMKVYAVSYLTKITNLLFLLVHYFKLKRLFYGVIWNQRIVIRLFCSTLVLCQKIKSLANYILWDGFFCSQIELVHLNITCVYATLNKIKYTQKTLILCTVLPYRICPALPSSWLRKGLFLKALCVHIIAHSYKSYFKPKQKYWPGLSATASCDAGDQCDSLDPIVFTHSKLSHFIASSAFVGLKKPSDFFGLFVIISVLDAFAFCRHLPWSVFWSINKQIN